MIPTLSLVNGIKPNGMMDNETISPEKRYYTPTKLVQNGTKDEPDNVNIYYKGNKSLFTSPTMIHGDNEAKSPKSFIQQRVERLYGPGALAQGFYSPKRTNSDTKSSILTERSPNQNYIQSKIFKPYSNGTSPEMSENSNHYENCQILDEQSLPVLRHLRPEFRAQLPILSPKRSPCKQITIENDSRQPINVVPLTETIVVSSTPSIINNTKVIVTPPDVQIDALASETSSTSSLTEVQPITNGTVAVNVSDTAKSVHSMTLAESNGLNDVNSSSDSSFHSASTCSIVTNGDRSAVKKDGHYFLEVINCERERLLGLALKVEKDTELLLANHSHTDEEIIGSLRSASGKARLLVSQKIQQFEGLCHNSLNQKPGEKYPTTSEDLQGFWDMVLLQVDHVDSLFKEIDSYRANNWMKPPDSETAQKQSTAKTISKRPLTAKSVYGNSYSTKSLSMSLSSDRANNAASQQSTTTKQKSAAAIAAAQRRELQRKQLLELKRKNKMLNSDKQHEPDIDICIDKNSNS